jgi:phospho-N-acetylmuramoyl-pentapeptide-transferase
MLDGQYNHLYILAFAWVCGIIGFLDDLAKVKRKKNQGLTAPQKLLLQLSAAAAFLALTRTDATTGLSVPFTSVTLDIPWAVYLTLAIIFAAGFINAVNFTDGADGLLSGVTIPVAAFFALAAVPVYRSVTDGDTAAFFKTGDAGASIFAGALAGALLGFLWFNFNPAKVFMGDTGSLFIGGALCGIAFVLNRPLILIVAGLIYVIEILSVVLQVTYFKLTKGKRIFKMSPIHHHFEMCGWSEKKIFAVFTAVSAALCCIAWFGW